MKYRIIPIGEFTDKPEVVEICRMLGHGEVTQNIAQAASWHAANGLSWKELAAKDRKRHLTTGWTEKYFHPRELQFAQRAVSVASHRAEQYKSLDKEKSPGELESENQSFIHQQTDQQQKLRRRRR